MGRRWRGKAFGQRQWKGASNTIVRSHDDAAPDFAGRGQRQIAPRREGAETFPQLGTVQRRGGEGDAALQPTVPVAAPACRHRGPRSQRARAACPTRKRDAAAASPFCLRATKSRQLFAGSRYRRRARRMRSPRPRGCVCRRQRPAVPARPVRPSSRRAAEPEARRTGPHGSRRRPRRGRGARYASALSASKPVPARASLWSVADRFETQQLTIHIDAELQQLGIHVLGR